MRKNKKIKPAVTVDAEVVETPKYQLDQCAGCTHVRRDHSFVNCKDCSLCEGFVEPVDGVVLQGDARPDLVK